MDLMEQLRKLWGEFLPRWNALERRRKVAVAALALAMVVAMGGLVAWARTPEYAVAFSGLKEEDAGAIVAKLKESKTPYQVDASGSVIRVPAGKMSEVRLEMARQGLLSGRGVGFEIFDQTKFGMTDFAEKLNYQRALEGELARTIGSLAAVDQVRVHLVIPQPTIYSEREKEATASVMLKLKPGGRLDKPQIRGIRQLVSSSVEGLKAENITIVDSQGNILTEGYAASAEGTSLEGSAGRLAIQRQYEVETEAKVRAMLEEALGPNKAVVRVNATFDWDQVESNSELYSPNSPDGTVRSAHTLSERYTGSGPDQAGGVPGTEANWPSSAVGTVSAQGLATDTIPTSYERSDITQNYELSKTVAHRVRAPGNLTRLSLAVLLDQAVGEAALASLKEAVTAAVGLDPSRGDAITVESLAFDRSYYEKEEKAMVAAERKELYLAAAKLGGGLLAVLVLLFILWRGFRGLQVAQPVAVGKAALPAEPATPAPKVRMEEISLELRQKREMQEELQMLALEEPEAIANVVRLWLTEGALEEKNGSSG